VSPHDCEERLVTQCKKIKAIDPTTKCFVYRNTELALEWLSSQRAVMQDPSRAGYFLQFQNDAKGKAAAKCKAAGGCSPPKKLSGGFCCPHDNIYCENQTPWKGEQQYFWVRRLVLVLVLVLAGAAGAAAGAATAAAAATLCRC